MEVPMIVLPSDYPHTVMTDSQVALVRDAILGEIIKTPAGDAPPQFIQSREVGGLLKVTCASQATRNWLVAAASRVVPWEGASLKAIEAGDLPSFKKVIVWIPNGSGDHATIFQRLEMQNPPLKTKGWKPMGTGKKDSKGETLALSIDDQSYQVLEKRGMRAYLNFSLVSFKLIGGTAKSEPHPGLLPGTSDKADEGPASQPAAQ